MRTHQGQIVADAITSGETDIPAAGTPVQLNSTSTKCFGVIVSNPNATNAIYVGDSAVDKTSARGIQLKAGEQVFIPVGDVNLLYADGTSNGDDVGWLILK